MTHEICRMEPIFGGPEPSPKGKRPRLWLIVVVIIAGLLLGFLLRTMGVF